LTNQVTGLSDGKRITTLYFVKQEGSVPKKGNNISKPMQVMALRFTEEDRERLQRIADEYDVTLSWVIREGAKLYADDLGKWLEERRNIKGSIGGRLAS
jgi:hypothetical protein